MRKAPSPLEADVSMRAAGGKIMADEALPLIDQLSPLNSDSPYLNGIGRSPMTGLCVSYQRPVIGDRPHAGQPGLLQVREEQPSSLQVWCLKALREPVVRVPETLSGVISAILGAPQPRQAHRRTQFQRSGLLGSRDLDRSQERPFNI